ncbi:hypothetical protein OG2516_00389 [Oceanicola granulosus HTCC2516]|uniref:Uncharacterized protein n=1 Tax=Oceanicola granulosus (strain ATCC BAA-861 / DSM 15982 / KCTC 12143 / HTCC2516) TaxID=314256 RepID=Q2CJG2_OCEGH|nr:hypothetical protein [Oceanicola granulosus]EAR52638.1 hypothetical protein OG2516_00389 [Oceanicola granulosus HTCC2516]
MQIVYHIGANCTDGERLTRSLAKNDETFAAQGIRVPPGGKYRRLLRETIQNLDGREPEPDTRDILLDAILDDESAERLVLSNPDFICIANRIFEGGTFYGLADFKVASFRRLFPEDRVEFHLALRNPATFIPAAFAESKSPSLETYLRGVDPLSVRWSDLVTRIRAAAPDAGLTIWCNEDTPLIWAQLIRELSGVDPMTKISGGFDLLNAIMSPEGMRRLLVYLKSHPPQTEVQKRRVIAAFLDKFAIDEEVEEEVDLPGWTDELVDALTAAYEEDVYAIERMNDVTFIGP